jgi:photosystem II stability/assembly factor-like uncharacterized protein
MNKRRYLRILGAFVVVGILIAGFLLFSLVRHLSIVGQAGILPGENQPMTSAIVGALDDVHMINAEVGWAESMHYLDDPIYSTVLRTTDGGKHWKAVLKCIPIQGVKTFVPCMTSFSTATSATVQETVSGNSLQGNYTRIYHTNDGGQTWMRSVIDASALETSPVFVNNLHGWVLLTSNFPGVDLGSAYIGKEITLYRTSDGGKNWQSIASGPATSQLGVTSSDAYGVPPLTASTRVTFINTSIGWMTGTSYHKDNSDYSWLYVTHDGGVTWKQATIGLPANSLIVNPPTFFTERDALLPVLISGPAPQYAQTSMLFTTHDGGQTWAGKAIPFDITFGGFADIHHGWAPIDGEDQAIYMTTDGWQHWMKKHIDEAFKRVYNFDFVSATTGWMLADNRTAFAPEVGGGIQKGEIIVLLRTDDGGQTWQAIAHSQL